MCGGLVDAQLLKDIRDFFPPIVARNFESKAFVGAGGGEGRSNSHNFFKDTIAICHAWTKSNGTKYL